MPNVPDAWSRIESWLRERAPRILANLNPGASDQEISETEAVVGIAMPNDWLDLYRRHDGMNDADNLGSLFYGMNFLTLDRVRNELRGIPPDVPPQKVRAADSGIDRADIHNRRWIPFAHDFGDTLLRVDMSPSDAGRQGQVIFTDHADDTAILLAASVSDFLWQFIDDLEHDRYFLNPEALADGQQFLSPVKEIDVINWSSSPRWRHLARKP